jgi:probable F420-dependent oxidoreductase
MQFCNMLAFIEDDQLIETAKISEDLGFDSISVSDHLLVPEKLSSIYPDTPDGKPFFNTENRWSFPDPWVALSMMAQATRRVRLLQSIFILPARHPVEVARATGSLAVLSNSRLSLCPAVGWMKEEFDTLGVDFRTRGQRTDEMIAILRKLWTGDVVEHHGEHYDFERLLILPQPGHVPIIASGPSDAVLKRAATLCDGWMSRMCHVEDMPPSLEKLKAFRREAGRENEPFEILMVMTDGWSVDEIRRAEDLGITQVVLLPAYFHLKRRSTLEEKTRLWEDYARKVLKAFGK